MRSEAGERKRAWPHHSDSLWSHRRFSSSPRGPPGPATDVPPTAHPLLGSLALWELPRCHDPAEGPLWFGGCNLRHPLLCLRRPRRGSRAPVPPRSPERRRAETNPRALQTRAPSGLLPAPTSSALFFHRTDFPFPSVHPGQGLAPQLPGAASPHGGQVRPRAQRLCWSQGLGQLLFRAKCPHPDGGNPSGEWFLALSSREPLGRGRGGHFVEAAPKMCLSKHDQVVIFPIRPCPQPPAGERVPHGAGHSGAGAPARANPPESGRLFGC